MLLAIDIGNSHTVVGIFKEKTLSRSWRIQTDRKGTADEIAATIAGLFSMQHTRFDQISGIIIASVVPPLQASWLAFARTLVSQPLLVDGMETGMPICTDNPAEVGADRIVNAVAAFHKYASPLIIVDFGTAITFDCVSAKGEYLGGAIAPGISISLEALGQKTAKLPRIDITSPPANPIGTNTVAAIQSGILYGYGGLVEGLLHRIKEQYHGAQPLVIGTGGMAQLIAPYTPSITSIEPQLTLEGLHLLYERHTQK